MNTRSYRMVAAIAAMISTASLSYGIELSWTTVDGGGGTSIGGGFELSATVGQPDAGSLTGGTFELNGGYWVSSAVGELCFGDLDGDGEVGLSDLATMLAHYGETTGMTYADGDLDGDGDVDLADLAALLAEYGCGT